MPRHSVLPFCAAMAVCGPALAFQPLIPLDVNATPTGFEVIEARGAGPSHIWCVAADHARHSLGASATQRLVITAPLGASQTEAGRKAVGFALRAADAAQSRSITPGMLGGFLLSVRTEGASLSVTQAAQYCTDHIEFP
jgi:hypothetical protein